MVIRFSGWRNPLNMTLISKNPFLLFDISAQFSSDITDLPLIPHDIYVLKCSGLRKKPSKKRLSSNWIKFCKELNKKGSQSSEDDLFFMPAADSVHSSDENEKR